jgi:hypothetical protein
MQQYKNLDGRRWLKCRMSQASLRVLEAASAV